MLNVGGAGATMDQIELARCFPEACDNLVDVVERRQTGGARLDAALVAGARFPAIRRYVASRSIARLSAWIT